MAEVPIGMASPPGTTDNAALLTLLTSPGWRDRFPEGRLRGAGASWFISPVGDYAARANNVRSQNFPDHQYPSIVGRPILRSEERDGDIQVKDIMCGDEAAAARSMLQITYPVCVSSETVERHSRTLFACANAVP